MLALRASSRALRCRALLQIVLALAIALGAIPGQPAAPVAAQVNPCSAPANPVVAENCLTGNPSSEWDLGSNDSSMIMGYATDISVDQGQTVRFKIDTDKTVASYRIDVYRMGYYAGMGARRVASFQPKVAPPQMQPACLAEPSVGLIDCGNWTESATWQVPANAVSGIYFAKLVRTDGTAGVNHVPFIVRDDDGGSDVLFQTSDTTWQAYNSYGGASLYVNDVFQTGVNRAYKVSYNRPFVTREGQSKSYLFNAEYPMVRWLERNGYDVSYSTGVDSDRRGAELLEHEAFLSVGHDEYWSGAQRANVEAARNAGVHLGFFSGNEVFWKTRWESAIDGSGTPYRTLVSYKETAANAPIDPSSAWTGTWRDPRFGPHDGNRPENGLTGTLFTVQSHESGITVPSADGKMRFWRNTDVATLGAGQSATLGGVGARVLGFEWDEDLDNGARPAGLIRMSTTTASVTEKLVDYGSTVAPGTATHSLTLYKHASGALVFGAGTIQWSWGLDQNHDRGNNAPDVRMQQATVNLLADMAVQPATLQSGLVGASASSDVTAPTSTITSPTAGAHVQAGSIVTITGTASDVGGRVGGVEVSVNGGATWHRASGRESWSYTWTPDAAGPATIRSRATDDSANVQTPGAGVAVTIDPRVCPCSVWNTSDTPAVASVNSASSIELGVRFTADVSGWVTGVRFYKGPLNTGTHVGNLWTNSGTLLASATFTGETATGWQQALFASPVPVTANTPYVVSYVAPNGGYAADSFDFVISGVDSAPLHVPADGVGGSNGLYSQGASGFPNQSYRSTNYWVDAVFSTTDTSPPVVIDRSPAPNATGASLRPAVTATFNEPVVPSTIVFQLRNSQNVVVPATVTYDDATRTATLTPTNVLTQGALYNASVAGARDIAGNVMVGTSAWSFTVATCPCTIWTDGVTPTGAFTNAQALEVGTKIRSDVGGYVTALRSYRPVGDTTTHTGNLWRGDGTLLASVALPGGGPSGWQSVTLPVPVQISADTTYVVSQHSATGRYVASPGYFAAGGVSNGPLRALANDLDGPNGVYKEGASGFPLYGSGGSNYWLDLVFSTTPPQDTTPPSVVGRTPAPGATGISFRPPVTATFSESVSAASIVFQLRDAAGALVPSSVVYDDPSRTATLTPTGSLSSGVTYTASVSGAADPAGNVMVGTTSWTFTTALCPCTLWGSAAPNASAFTNGQPLELGTKVRPDVNGYFTGLRFYKSAGDTGVHTGHLWRADGTLLATAVFVGETASGWQQVNLDQPVAASANTTYVASYHSSAGRYISSPGYFASSGTTVGSLQSPANGVDGPNGSYSEGASAFPAFGSGGSNYWADAVFALTPPLDTTPPSVVLRSPAPGATDAPLKPSVRATFSEAVQVGSIVFTLRTAAGALVPGSVAYDAPTKTATFTPTGLLAIGASYTASVRATDTAGNPMAAADTWSFSTPSCPCTLWPNTATPAIPAIADSTPIEVGLLFRSDVSGYVTGVRFYKGPGNTGSHVGKLYTLSGTLLASATFTGESTTGWQQVAFATPVPVTAGTTYVVSYFAPNGRYSYDGGYFASAAREAGPLRAPAGPDVGGNGVFRYGSAGFPTSTYNNANYWVDAVFTNVAPPDTTPPTVIARSPLPGATSVGLGASVTATFSEPVTAASIVFTLRDGAGAVVPTTFSYDAPTRTATLTPNSSLVPGVTYTARVSGARDAAGNVMVGTDAWSFSTPTCPCTLWPDTATPTASIPSSEPIELGVKFRSAVAGIITGMRFYKPVGSTGTHTVNLWAADGTLLETATLRAETASGWQEVEFASKVSIDANTTYVASYFAENGGYAYDGAYFATGPWQSGPLTALSDAQAGGNGVYRSGSTGFPTSSYNATNYWVDVVFTP